MPAVRYPSACISDPAQSMPAATAASARDCRLPKLSLQRARTAVGVRRGENARTFVRKKSIAKLSESAGVGERSSWASADLIAASDRAERG